jgi:hypothetical protein
MDKIIQTQQLIGEINRMHREFSNAYFETGRMEKINLSRTIGNVPASHIYQYRLTLHECVNDYLMTANIEMKYFYRVKTRESIDDKIQRYSTRENQYPVNNWLNDIFGARIVLEAGAIQSIISLLDVWKNEFNLKNWYVRDQDGYRGLHVYFKNQSNFYYPWELQIWDEQDIQSNIHHHEQFKRSFLPSARLTSTL